MSSSPSVTSSARAKTVSPKKKVGKKPASKITKKAVPKKTTKKTPVKIATKAAVKKTQAKVTKKTLRTAASSTSSRRRVAAAIKQGLVTGIKRHPLGHLMIERELRKLGFRGKLLSDEVSLHKYSTDESIFAIAPQLILVPKDERDVRLATEVTGCLVKRFPSISLTPRAAGSGLSGGSLTDSIVLDTMHLNTIEPVQVSKSGITITCEPGAMWHDVEKALAKYDAYLPSFPASKDLCTIGGSVANNAAGPDSLRYGHTADWVESLEIILHDGKNYLIKPLTYKEFTKQSKQKNELGRITREIWELISKNQKVIQENTPTTTKNSAGYALWSVLNTSVTKFKKGDGTFDLTRLIAGSQGTVGIITKITMRALPIPSQTTLISVPVFALEDAPHVVETALKYNPINLELFDAASYELALQNPDFFKNYLSGLAYYRTMFAMYSTYHVRYKGRLPELSLLITLDKETLKDNSLPAILVALSTKNSRARVVRDRYEAEALWQVRRASYSLCKLQSPKLRPAAFLEDMVVPPEHLATFFIGIKKLLREFRVQATVHGHGGNGHFHFYPLIDFTNPTTPLLVEKMAERFFKLAVKYDGNICGEHNDGIIRTPHLNKIFSTKMIKLFEINENIFDPDDIFNPGKKVNPRFDIKTSIRKAN